MALDVPDRVHIVPLGYEYERVIQPLKKYEPDRVYVLENDEDEKEKPAYHQDIKEEIEEMDMELKSVWCDIFDLYPVVGAVSQIAMDESDEDVYINLTTGSKITAIGGMLACMMTMDEADVRPYYVRSTPDGYNLDKETPMTDEISGEKQLPTYPIEGPEDEQVEALAYIHENGRVTKGDLIKHLRTVSVVEQFGLDRIDSTDQEADPQVGEYRRLDNSILNPMSKRGWVSVEKVGTRKEITTTADGDDVLEAFKYLVE